MLDARGDIPSHVPEELVVDVDVYDLPGGDVDPQIAWRSVQGRGPLIYTPRYGGHWIATTGPDIAKFYRDFHNFSSTEVVIPPPGGVPLLPIQADPPVHKYYRGTINQLFSPAVVQRLSGDIRMLATSLIDTFIDKGECEFNSEFSVKFPLMIFLRIMGLPLDDLLYLRRIVDQYASSSDIALKQAANAELAAYLEKAIDERIENPRDDGITIVSQGVVDGRPFTRFEMLATCVNLLQAGLDTVTNMLGFIVHHLARHPEQRAYIRANFDRMHDITQELMRRFPIANMCRILANDFEYKGVTMKAGDMMFLPTSLYNLDENFIAHPEQVDFHRPASHITFGSGRHTCAGAVLARKEISIFLEEWLTRIPDFTIAPDRQPVFKASAINSAYKIWLQWPVAQAA